MHRMRRFALLLGLSLVSIAVIESGASAALIRPAAGRAYPDIAADINGTVNYRFDPATRVGNFQVTNTPYLIAGGATSDQEYSIVPDSQGVRRQVVNVSLNENGQLIDDPGNNYELWGTINAQGQTFNGLLLKGTPTAFGSQDLGVAGVQGSDVFDMDVNITGGALADYFGPDAYIRITPELQSSFEGSFATDFSATKATSNTRGYSSPKPFPIPEPATLALLLVGGGAGLAYRRRRSK